ncbi:MAG: glutamine synthetase family protein [Prolixibacteraceae bacterium]|jgi:glutamine synthetase|nr:glutamine synthetase family protein [Prolixibacteraceae bacterium]
MENKFKRKSYNQAKAPQTFSDSFNYTLTANKLERYLHKPSDNFTSDDIIEYVFEKDIEMINFRYISADEKLKTINFVVTGRTELENLLKYGERVNGSSVFPYNKERHPDLYITPIFSTAFVNPFAIIPTLDIICSFFTWEGEKLSSSPENILQNAVDYFQEKSGYEIKMFSELEYYTMSQPEEGFSSDEGNYQSSEPFSKFEQLRAAAIKAIAQCGGKVRYGHAEHGAFQLNGKHYEQHEIEFLPCPPAESIRQVILSKWIIRMLGHKHGVNISFSPKVAIDKPGNGLHTHFILEKDGINILGEGSEFRKSSLKMISGILNHAGALSAFGNSIPVSYLRLAHNQLSPHHICWGPSNRSALIRIPKINMKAQNQRLSQSAMFSYDPLYIYNQTMEYRGTDASAYMHFFVAAMLIAGIDGMNNPNYLQEIKQKLASTNLYHEDDDKIKEKFKKLPESCGEAAEHLIKERKLFTETHPIFPDRVIDYIIDKLTQFEEKWDVKKIIHGNDEEQIDEFIKHFMHYR